MSTHHLLILYGSQTGQAESIARDLHREAPDHRIKAKLMCMDQFKKFDLQEEKMLVIVCSTTGEGDPPDNASRLWRRLKKKDLASDHLSHLKYTVLGLGDTNYTNFCAMGKNLHQRLTELGATPFYAPGWADDGTGMELVVEPWKENLYAAVKAQLGEQSLLKDVPADSTVTATDQAEEEDDARASSGAYELPHGYTLDKLKLPRLRKPSLLTTFDSQYQSAPAEPSASIYRAASISKYRCMTAPDAVRRTLHVELDLIGTGYDQYVPGDAFAVACPNTDAEVAELIQLLNLEAQQDSPVIVTSVKSDSDVPRHLQGRGLTPRILFKTAVDLRAMPKKALLRTFAEHAEDGAHKLEMLWLSSQQGGNDFTSQCRASHLSVLGLLRRFSSCRPPLNVFIEHVGALQPRYYSAASASEGSVQFAFNVIDDVHEDGSNMPGLCTTHIERIAQKLHADALCVADMRQAENINTWYSSDNAMSTQSLCASFNSNDDASEERKRGILKDESPSPLLAIYLRPSLGFTLPADMSKPLLLVGPGTGIAPFIGFLQARQSAMQAGTAVGDCLVVAGFRNRDKDFLFKEELSAFSNAGVITKLAVAFSRDADAEYKYVQHALMAHAADCSSIMEEGTMFVCGSATTLGKSFDDELDKILAKGWDVPVSEASAKRQELFKTKRIRKELWA